MMTWRDIILTPEQFYNERPDLQVHNEITIKSAINQSIGILDAETNGLLGRVWSFNFIDPGFAPDSDLKRSEWELNQIKEAVITQTQYIINLGNDMTVGSTGYSMGGINSTFTRPENRPIVAPGVFKLLQNGRIYFLQDFVSSKTTNKKCDCWPDDEYLTRTRADGIYLAKFQPNVEPGRIAVVRDLDDRQITFDDPKNVLKDFDAKRIWDPVDEIYKFISEFNVNYFGGLTRQEIYDAISLSGTVWRADIIYRKDYIVGAVDAGNNLRFFISLIDDNVGNDPFTSPNAWKEVIAAEIDYNLVVEQCKPFIEEEIKKQLDALPGANDKKEGEGQIISFENNLDFENFKNFWNVDDTYFQDADGIYEAFTDGLVLQVIEKQTGKWVSIDNENGDIVSYKNNDGKEIPLTYNIGSPWARSGNTLNGKPIYVLHFTNVKNNNTLISGIDKLVNCSGLAKETASDKWLSLGNNKYEFSVFVENGLLKVELSDMLDGNNNYLTIYYTEA